MLTTRIALVLLAALSLGCSAPESEEPPQMFSEADNYELFMGRWSRQMAPLLVEFAGVNDGERILDVGSGTGSLAAAIADGRPGVTVVGIDPAAAYVEHAAAKAGGANVSFRIGDAQALEFADDSFDRSVSLLVVNFIPDAGKAVGELKRVTRPGGVVSAAVWDYAEGMEMLREFWDAVVELNPEAEALDEKNMPYCDAGELTELWREAGLTDIEETALTVPMTFASFEDFWQPFLAGQGPAGAYVNTLSVEARTELRKRLRERVPLTMNARAWAVRGVAP
jgi:ubiquinone/menaquinone biosynthesis C-methylase UbiE